MEQEMQSIEGIMLERESEELESSDYMFHAAWFSMMIFFCMLNHPIK